MNKQLTAADAKTLAEASTAGRWRIALAGILRRIERRAKAGESSMLPLRLMLCSTACSNRVVKELRALGYSVAGEAGRISWE